MSKFIRQFSEIAFNKAFKLKTLEIPEYLEKSMRRYVNEQLNKHNNEILKYADKQRNNDFWKFLSISLTGFGSVVGLNYMIKNEIKSDIKEIKDELNNKIDKLENKFDKRFEIIDRQFEIIDRRFEKLESKINDIDKKLDIIISSKKK